MMRDPRTTTVHVSSNLPPSSFSRASFISLSFLNSVYIQIHFYFSFLTVFTQFHHLHSISRCFHFSQPLSFSRRKMVYTIPGIRFPAVPPICKCSDSTVNGDRRMPMSLFLRKDSSASTHLTFAFSFLIMFLLFYKM